MGIDEHKRCTQCHELFPATEGYFHWRDVRHISFRSKCKVCHWKNLRGRKRDKKAINERARANYKLNKEHIAAYQKRYRLRKATL